MQSSLDVIERLGYFGSVSERNYCLEPFQITRQAGVFFVYLWLHKILFAKAHGM